MLDIISTTLFEAQSVSVFRIPPGEISLSKWNLADSNTIWKGDMRLVEEELVQEDVGVFSKDADTDSLSPFAIENKQSGLPEAELAPVKPYKGLRLKLELFNVSNSVVVPPNESRMEELEVWGEVWYNPLPEESDNPNNSHYAIANNGQETIQMTPQSAKFYKIIVQLPGTGYHPFIQEDGKSCQDDNLLQVALGLKISENFAAISFSESLSIYKRRFRNFVDQYNYELRFSEIEHKQKHLTLDRSSDYNEDKLAPDDHHDNENKDDDDDDDDDNDDHDDDEDDDDDFGDFVGG